MANTSAGAVSPGIEDKLTPNEALDRIEVHSHELAQVGRALLAVSDLALTPEHLGGGMRVMLSLVERDDLAALMQVLSDTIRRKTRELDETIGRTHTHREAVGRAAG